jgi:hypothetical protein
MEINIPNEYERYFTSSYSNNWYNQGIIGYDHKNEKKIIPKIVWMLKESDYEPAKPFVSFRNRWWRF